MGKISKFIDPFILLLVTTVALASLLPCRGMGATVFSHITAVAIGLLFFLHGAKLSREALIGGIGHWRLHLLVLACTFLLFPLIGVAVRLAAAPWVDPTILAGVVFLCLLPSTVQSSIAFTAMAGGNMPAAICSASLSNLLGILVTPVLVSLLLATSGSAHGAGGGALSAVRSIAEQLLAPFIAGHLCRPLLVDVLAKYKPIVGIVDRGSILLVVYTAFSAAVVEGIWRQLSGGDLVALLLLSVMILAAVVTVTTWGGKILGFSREDRIAIVFCGSKKSLVSGVPMAGVLFPAPIVGAIILPLMLFHQMQLMFCAVLARRYAAEGERIAALIQVDSLARAAKETP